MTDFGVAADGKVFMATDYLDGESLEARLRRVQRLPLFDAINIVKQVAHGLGAAHELGIVHRDLKPANISLCSREGRRRIVRRSKETGMRFAIVPEKTFDLVKGRPADSGRRPEDGRQTALEHLSKWNPTKTEIALLRKLVNHKAGREIM